MSERYSRYDPYGLKEGATLHIKCSFDGADLVCPACGASLVMAGSIRRSDAVDRTEILCHRCGEVGAVVEPVGPS